MKFNNLIKQFALIFIITITPLLCKSQFGEEIILSLEIDEVSDAELYDLDNDGDLDVLFCSWNGNYSRILAWYENIGNGEFYRVRIIGNIATPSCLSAADFDADGDLDVVVASHGNNYIYIFENIGNKIFESDKIIVDVIQVQHVSAMLTADIDGDGDADILVGAGYDFNSSKISWFENTGDMLVWVEHIFSQNNFGSVHSLSVGDLDGDGDFDVLSAAGGNNDLMWHENNGLGYFGISVTLDNVSSTGSSGGHYGNIADLDGDGDLDILSAKYDSIVSWYENINDTSFAIEQIISTSGTSINYIGTTDIDNDNDLDIIVQNLYSQEILILNNDGNAVFTMGQSMNNSFPSATVNYPPGIIDYGDIDGDGVEDILAAVPFGKGITWFKNLNNGIYDTEIIIPPLVDGAISIRNADIDNDGDEDIFTISLSGDIVWFENWGNNQFKKMQFITSTTILSFILHDFDDDGDLDIVSASGTDLIWLENVGAGVFLNEVIISSYTWGINYILECDFNADNQKDILFDYAHFNETILKENLGNGNYASDVTIYSPFSANAGSGINYMYPSDIDGDDDEDLLGVTTSGITVIENVNNLGFGDDILTITDQTNYRNFTTDDINGDSIVDVVSFRLYDLFLYENDGPLVLDTQKIVNTVSNTISWVHTADIENDGDVDIFTASNDSIHWHENTGNGIFEEEKGIKNKTWNFCKFLTLQNITNDDKLDLLNCGENYVSLFINETNYIPDTTSIVNYNNKIDAKLFPNPAKNTITINFEEIYSDIQFEIYNIEGKIIIEKEIKSSDSIIVDVASLSKGYYIISLILDGYEIKRGFVKS